MKALIALEDGTVFEGKSFGAKGEKEGEIVFNTSMTGYQEIMTDPSYKGQIVTMTYPLIGNYGVNSEDVESSGPQVEGFIVREFSRLTSNYRAEDDFYGYLEKHGIIGVEEVDTRALTRHIRVKGAMKGIISSVDLDPERLVAKAKASRGIVGVDLVKEVTCREPYEFEVRSEAVRSSEFGVRRNGAPAINGGAPPSAVHDSRLTLHDSRFTIDTSRLTVVVMDFGVKLNILRMLTKQGCRVIVVPADAKARDILAMEPRGVLLSNGPGDPEGLPYAIGEIRDLLGKVPVFGICLGQQLLGLAYGGNTYKLKFGHRGANQPIKDLTTGRVGITSENHGFAVNVDSLPPGTVRVTHLNLNDGTVEGIEHTVYPAFSVQFHPEASPGPHDSYGLFSKFREMMEAFSASPAART
jgi:carbamoyl-phosphate synthase small subunit